MNEARRKMILDWMRKIHQLEYAHRYDSLKWASTHKWMGLCAFGLSLMIAFSFRFPEVEVEFNGLLKAVFAHSFLVALASTVVAILTGLQTFLKPNEKAELHKNTGSNYERLRHRIEVLLTTEFTERELKKRIESIRQEWVSLDAINVSPKSFAQGKERAMSFNKYHKELDFLPDVK